MLKYFCMNLYISDSANRAPKSFSVLKYNNRTIIIVISFIKLTSNLIICDAVLK